jgi:hypothetical protein
MRRKATSRMPLHALTPPTHADAPRIAGLVERARELHAIATAVSAALSPTLAAECEVANVRGSRLIVLVRSSTAAARIRLLAPALLDAARRSSGLALESVTVKVAPASTVPTVTTAAAPSLSPAAAAHLKHAADSVADPELRAVLLRLASLA